VSDAFEEVEEDLRRERYAGFFKQYWMALVIALVVLIGGILGFQWYQKWSAERAGETAGQLAQAQELLESGEFAAADRLLTDIIKSAPSPYKTVALTMSATAKLEQREPEEALKRLDEAAKAANDPLLRDNAALKAAYVAADVQDFKTLEPRLTKLVESKGPFVYLARELYGAEAFEAGDLKKAREQFTILASAIEAPEGVRGRARRAQAVIGTAESAGSAAKPAAPAAAPAAKPGESE
jgi:hypothetical protein